MNDSSKRIADLEDFLFGTNEQPIDDVLSSLRQAGIDTDNEASRVQDMVNEKHRKQLQMLPDSEIQSSTELPQLLADVSSMPHELLFAAFTKLRNGELGKDLQDAAKARLSENNFAKLSGEELRLWLEEFADSQNESD